MFKGPKPHMPPGSKTMAGGQPSQPNVVPAPNTGGPVGIRGFNAPDSKVTNAAKKKVKHGKPNKVPSQFGLKKEGKPNMVPGFRK